MTRRCLIVKLGALGDVASVLPAAWKLRQSGAEIDWLCGRSVAPLLACYSWVRTIVIDDTVLFGKPWPFAVRQIVAAWTRIAGIRYELCATLQYDWRYRALTLPVWARRSITLEDNRREFSLVSERHHAAEFDRILCGTADGYRAENLAPPSPDTLPANPMPRNGKIRIALAPGGARNALRDDPLRRWPLDAYAALAARLLAKSFEVVLTGGPSDAWVETAFQGLPLSNCIARWSVPQLLAFYGACDCVITHDTGPLHLAGLTRCGVVGIFGPTVPSKALPRRAGVVALWGGQRLPCRPCYDGRTFAACARNECTISITPARVMAAVESLLAHPNADWRVESV
jgi:heptosyltransferase II